MNAVRVFENWAAPLVLVMARRCSCWAVGARGRLRADARRSPRSSRPRASSGRSSCPRSPAMVGFWATLSLNIPDFTRFARAQREQMLGQTLGLPTTMVLFSFIGVAVTSATPIIFGEAIWDPVTLLGRLDEPLVDARCHAGAVHRDAGDEHRGERGVPGERLREPLAAADLLQDGGLITGVVGMLIMPWKLLAVLERVHLHVADRLLGAAGADRRHHDRRLLPGAPPRAGGGGSVPARWAYEFAAG